MTDTMNRLYKQLKTPRAQRYLTVLLWLIAWVCAQDPVLVIIFALSWLVIATVFTWYEENHQK